MNIEWKEYAPYHHLRQFQAEVDDGHLTVLVGREPAGPNNEIRWHLSISHRSSRIVSPVTGKPAPGRIPAWEEIKDARYAFVPDEAYMAMILPPKADYVNVHPTTMHLHEIPEVAE